MRPAVRNATLIAAGVAMGLAAAPVTAQAAINYFDTTKTVSGSGTATCPSGWKVTGGGAGPLPNNTYSPSSSDEYELTGSFPSTSGWKATGTRVHGTYSTNSGWRFTSWAYSPRVYAICTN